jgi:hypothetical protein
MSTIVQAARPQTRTPNDGGRKPPVFLGENEIHETELVVMKGREEWDTWRITQARVDIILHVEEGRYVGQRREPDGSTSHDYSAPVKRRIVGKQGDLVRVPRCYRSSIAKEDANGTVVQGLCPWGMHLVEDGVEQTPKVAPALDTTVQPVPGKVAEPGAESRLRARAKKSASS